MLETLKRILSTSLFWSKAPVPSVTEEHREPSKPVLFVTMPEALTLAQANPILAELVDEAVVEPPQPEPPQPRPAPAVIHFVKPTEHVVCWYCSERVTAWRTYANGMVRCLPCATRLRHAHN